MKTDGIASTSETETPVQPRVAMRCEAAAWRSVSKTRVGMRLSSMSS
jgi:hypothetical protein